MDNGRTITISKTYAPLERLVCDRADRHDLLTALLQIIRCEERK